MSYNIPLFKLNFDKAEEESALSTIQSKWISSGPKCAELEEKFARMTGAQYAVAVSNCTAALHLAVLGAGIEPGDEVLVPSLTFVATVNAVRYAGGIPVFCDIVSTEDLTISPEEIEKKITSRTKAVIVMHYAGFACNMDAVMDIAHRHGLKVIEDACHGPLSEYHGQKLGTIGDAGCFSFFSNKNISTGEGGIITTNDENLYHQFKLMRSHGMTTMSYDRAQGHSTNYDVVALGYNYRLDDIRAAIGIAQLDKLAPDIDRRALVRKKYLAGLDKMQNLTVPFRTYQEISAAYIFPVVLKEGTADKRDKLRNYLAEQGIQTSVHYPPAHRFQIYKDYVKYALPNTEYAADCEITLPMYGSLTDDEIDYICSTLHEGLKAIL